MISDLMSYTFFIKFEDRIGTAFAINRHGRQYLVTARHVVLGIKSGQTIGLRRDDEWESLTVNVVGTGVGKTDVAVLAFNVRMAPSAVIEATTGGLG